MMVTARSEIARLLAEKRWIQEDLIWILGGTDRGAVSQILRGRRAVSPRMSQRLGEAFGTSGDYFLRLQYEENLERARAPDVDEIKRRREEVMEREKEKGQKNMNMIEFENIETVGVGWEEETGRVWVCVNGECVFRSKTMGGKMRAFPNNTITQSSVNK